METEAGGHTVDGKLGVADNLPDDALALEVGQRLARERAVDLQPVDQHGGGDKTVGQHVLVEAVLDGLVHDDGVLGLILHCARILSISGRMDGATVTELGSSSTYPFPWTTSSIASFLPVLRRGPVSSPLASRTLHSFVKSESSNEQPSKPSNRRTMTVAYVRYRREG